MRRLDTFQNKSDTPLIVGPGNSISQSFMPLHNNLAGIRIIVLNPKLGGNASYVLTVSDENNNTIRQEYIKESNLGWQQIFRYDFVPINDSANKKFLYSISYLGENNERDLIYIFNLHRLGKPAKFLTIDESDRIEKSYVGIGYSASSSYDKGVAFIRSEQLEGDIAFQLYYQTTFTGFMKDSLNDFFGRLKYDSSFFTFYLLLLLSLIVVLIYRLRSKKWA